jgi:hypothetical protein
VALVAGSVTASTVIGLSVEDHARLSKLVVVGEVVSLRGIEHPDFGIETAVEIRVGDVLKGKVSAGDTVVFHTREGAVGDVVSEAQGEARFSIGQKVLLFIEDVDGRLYNVGLSTGVWNVQDRAGDITFTRAITDGLEVVGDGALELGPIGLRDMTSRVTFAEAHPQFDEPMLNERLGGGRKP